MEYLQEEQLGGVLAKGLAQLYLNQPKFPIDYLAKWLLTYSKNIKLQDGRIEKVLHKEQLIKQNIEHSQQVAALLAQQEQAELAINKKHEAFIEQIKTAQYHDEFLRDTFCQYLADKMNLNVYVCELDYPTKEFNATEDDDENAHVNLEGTKLLSYLYASKGHEFMVKQLLQPETGVTYEAIKEPVPNEDGEIQPNRGIYIPDVVKDPRMIFHKWPKLGAFYAIAIGYNSVIFEQAFDTGLEQRTAYLTAKENQDREKAVKEIEFEERMDVDDPAVVEQERQAYLATLEPVVEQPLQVQKKELILCVDTLGQDRQISEEDRNNIFNLGALLSRSWELQEIHAMQADIDRQLKYLEGLGQPYKERLEQSIIEEEQYVEANQDKWIELKEQNEKQYLYELECLKLEKIKERLQDKEYIMPLLQLGECRFIKFPQVIQAALYLLGYDKQEINQPGTNRLNWRHVQKTWDEDLIQKIVNYTHRGPKEQPEFKWSLVDRVQKRIEKLDQEQVDGYNMPYGRLLKYLILLCKLRRQDIELRREGIANKRKQIELAKEEAQKILETKEQQLKEVKEQIPPEELEEWNQEEWEMNFDGEHPMPEILENPIDEVDDDYVFEQQQQA